MDKKTRDKTFMVLSIQNLRNGIISVTNRLEKHQDDADLKRMVENLIKSSLSFQTRFFDYMGMNVEEAFQLCKDAQDKSEISYEEIRKDIEKLDPEEQELIKKHLAGEKVLKK